MRNQNLLATALLLAAALPAQTTRVVPTEYATIQAAIDASVAGDSVLVLPGHYPELIDFGGKRLQVTADAGPAATTIDGAGGNDAVVTVDSGEPAGTLLRGFTITGGKGKPFPSSYVYDYYGGGVFVGGGSKLRLENCRIVNNALSSGTFAGGVYSGGRGTHVDVVRCVIANNHAWASGGATLVDHEGTMSFERCTVTANTSTNFFGHQGGIAMANYGGVTVLDSIVWGNSGAQIAPFGSPYDQGTSATVTYSDVQGGFVGAGNIALDPLFLDADASDFHLRRGSPCIDAGDPASPLDPDGTRTDMGALYFDQRTPAAWRILGQGCGGGANPPRLDAITLPRLGTDFTLRASSLPMYEVGVLYWGFRDDFFGAPLPVELAPIGLPNCLFFTSGEFAIPFSSAAQGAYQSTVGVPADSALSGLQFRNQVLVRDRSVGPIGINATNGGEGVIGT